MKIFVDTLLQPTSKSQKSYLSLKRQMWKTEYFLFRWTLWVLTQIYSKMRVYWNCLSQSIWKFYEKTTHSYTLFAEAFRQIIERRQRRWQWERQKQDNRFRLAKQHFCTLSGGSVIFVPKGGGGPCGFYQPYFEMPRPPPPPPYTFWPVPYIPFFVHTSSLLHPPPVSITQED